MVSLTINGKTFDVDVEPDTPLLWVLRDTLGLTGTKYGCGIAQCGACTVHIDGAAMRSCSFQVSDVAGKKITTIEGLAANGVLHKVQKAWLEHDVPQCGYCQSGMIMAVAALLKDKPKPTDADIDERDHQHLSLRHLPASARGHSRRRQRLRRHAMNYMPKIESPFLRRRHCRRRRRARARPAIFPFGPDVVRAADGSPEVNAWVVIKPDDTVVIRIARSEMGQGTLTGLAQLVAEELECDWSKVTTEYPTPGQNLARNRVWGDISTGGSRGIRTSHEYVREGGRRRAHDADRGGCQRMEGAGFRMQRGEQRDHASAVGARRRPTARWPKLRPSSKLPRRSRSRTRKTGRSPARASSGSTPRTSLPASSSTASTSRCPACSSPPSGTARSYGGKVKSYDAAKVAGMPGVKKVVPVGDSARRGCRRHVLAR